MTSFFLNTDFSHRSPLRRNNGYILTNKKMYLVISLKLRENLSFYFVFKGKSTLESNIKQQQNQNNNTDINIEDNKPKNIDKHLLTYTLINH